MLASTNTLSNRQQKSASTAYVTLIIQDMNNPKFFTPENELGIIFKYYNLKKRIEINKKTAQVTEKIISSNEIMMEAVEDSKKVNSELVNLLTF